MIGYVSGETRRAVLLEAGQFFGYSLDDPGKKVRLERSGIGYFFMHSRDVEQVDCQSSEELLVWTRGQWSRDRALRLALIALDPNTSRLARERCTEACEELIVDPAVRQFVLNRLYSSVLPEDFPLREVSEFLSGQVAPILEDMFDTLVYHQTSIRSCLQAWDDLPDDVFGGADREEVRERVARIGAFYDFATFEGGSNDTLLKILADPVMRGSRAAAARQIVAQWASRYKEKPKSLSIQFLRSSALEPEFAEAEMEGLSNFDAFQQVKKQINQIKIEITNGHDDKVNKLVSELADFQRKGRRDLLSKSLCDIASFAKQLGDIERSVELTKMAVEEVPGDAWAHIQLGNSLVQKGDAQGALEQFRLGEVYGDLRAALIGRADVLRYLGQKEQALEAIDECVRKFPLDDVARNFKASILSYFGELDEALSEYNSIVELSIPTAFTFCGRAAVLHDLGQHREALEDQDTAISLAKDDPIPVVQKADMLREQCRFSDALKCVDVGQHRAPRWRLQYGSAKARVLRDQGKWRDCNKVLQELVQQFPRDMAVRMTAAELERRQGKFDAALDIYLDIERMFNQARTPRISIASCYAALGRFKEAIYYLPDWEPAARADWHAIHVRGMIDFKRGNYSEARRWFDRGLKDSPWLQQRPYFAAGLALVDLQLRNYDSAKGILLEVSHEDTLAEPGIRLLRTHAMLGDEFIKSITDYTASDATLGALLLQEIGKAPHASDESSLVQAEWSYIFTLAA